VFACDAPEGRFCVDYYKGWYLAGEPLNTSKTPYIRYNWGYRSPAHNVPYDNFSARWRGIFLFEAGEYQFDAHVDDGIRILLDGRLILEHWQDNSENQHQVKVTPGQGQHLVEVEYFDATDDAYLQVDWRAVTSKAVEHVLTPISAEAGTYIRKSVTPNASKSPFGINLISFDYYSPAVPFKDLMSLVIQPIYRKVVFSGFRVFFISEANIGRRKLSPTKPDIIFSFTKGKEK